MSWKHEHGLEYEVPGLIDFMVKAGILEDFSWHNDSMPSFAVKDPEKEEYGVRIWVAHPLKSSREDQGGKRFHVQEGEFVSESYWELDTDDLEEAIISLLERADKYFPSSHRPNFDDLVSAWRRSTYKSGSV